MSYEDMMDEHAALAHEISNRDLHVEELEKRIEELKREYKEAMTAWGADVKELTLSLSQRENRNAELEWKLKKVDALVLRLSAGYDWTSLTDDEVALLQEIMDTDRDGVPR